MVRHQWIQPTVRQRLLEDALQFVRTASRLSGVLRLALLGSLATAKPEPKDVDLLLTATDEADLTPMASAARRLQGHAQSYNHGADVFVADLQGHYVGRPAATETWCSASEERRELRLYRGEKPGQNRGGVRIVDATLFQ